MKKIAIATLGCKVNQFESASFSSSFQEAGCELVSFSEPADVYVINTCSVTGRAGQQSRQLIRRARKTNPEARLVVTGCYAQMAGGRIREITGGALSIVGNGNKHLLVETALAEDNCEAAMLTGDIGLKEDVSSLPVRRFEGSTRAYLRIQDGCNNFCSYCIVPYTRGRSRSVPPDEVLKQAEIFAGEGYRELVITGINVGKYGLDREENMTMVSLITELCRCFPHIRFRLSSVEPTEVDDRLLSLLSDQANFMPHLHIPLQSGDDAVLARMNRRYRAADFRRVVERIHAVHPSTAVGCDVLCGFPGETEAAFANTFTLLADLPLTYLHVFPYSKRPGTLAATLTDQVEKAAKQERVERLRNLGRDLKAGFYRRHIGTLQQVLVERRDPDSGLMQGFTENYIQVRFEGEEHLAGTIVTVRLTEEQDAGLFGIVDPS